MKLPSFLTNNTFARSMNSPLVRHISLVVFLSIVLVEIILLMFTSSLEEDRLLQRVDDSLELILPIYESSNDYAMFDVLVSGHQEEMRYPITGLVIRSFNGVEYYAGETQGLRDISLTESRSDRFDSSTGTYEVFIEAHEGDSQHSQAWFRVDAKEVAKDMQGFIWRIVAIILVSSLFVTLGCVFALTPILLQPILNLRQQMANTRKNGLGSYKTPTTALSRKDELGDTYREFDWMHRALLDAEKSTQIINNRFQDFADLGADCFWELDRAQRFVFIAGDCQGLFGYSANEIVGKRLDTLVRLDELPFSNTRELLCALLTENQWEGALTFPSEPRLERTVRIVSTPIFRGDGSLVGMRGTATNTTVASRMARDLNHLASHDALTGLYNRRRFDEFLQESINKYNRYDEIFCVCLLDLDRFKIVNDNSGHAAGDSLLKELSDIINKYVGRDDIVSRYGGDEFTILLKNCKVESGIKVCEKIRHAISSHTFSWESVTHEVGVSVGIVEINANMAQVSDLLSAADACCYKAKHLGRNQVQTIDAEEDCLSLQGGDSRLVELIKNHLREDSLQLSFEPIRELREYSHETQHYDVTLSFEDNGSEKYQRGSYLATAERHGLMQGLDQWMIAQTIRQIEELSISDQANFLVHFEISDASAVDIAFQQTIEKTIVESEKTAKNFCFVFSESVALRGGSPISDFMLELQDLGCQVALRGFYSGFSSLAFATNLPIDIFKIDGDFLGKSQLSAIETSVLQCMIEVSRLQNICTVAMNVENEKMVALFTSLGVDMVQGKVSFEASDSYGLPLQLQLNRPFADRQTG